VRLMGSKSFLSAMTLQMTGRVRRRGSDLYEIQLSSSAPLFKSIHLGFEGK
jgi:hypothetical protein